MFIEQPPWIFRALYPKAIFRMSPDEKAVYLTFDDGPIPEVTPWVLELLDKYDIKATFFMVGDNIRKYSEWSSNAGTGSGIIHSTIFADSNTLPTNT